jgi:ribosome-binding protein aMBF1 (putative translation factor)
MKKLAKKPGKAGIHSMKPLVDELLKDPEVRLLFEQEKAKTQIAQVVYAARKRAHLTQSQLAKKIGTQQSAIARLESSQDDRLATMTILSKIAKACGGVFEFGFRFPRSRAVSR